MFHQIVMALQVCCALARSTRARPGIRSIVTMAQPRNTRNRLFRPRAETVQFSGRFRPKEPNVARIGIRRTTPRRTRRGAPWPGARSDSVR